MAINLSQRIQSIKDSATLAVAAKAAALKKAGHDIIDLSIGEPDFDTPRPIKEAAIAAIQSGQTKYTPVGGTPQLKNAIVEKFQRENHLHYTPAQILVSCGAKQSFFNVTQAYLNPGDEVLIPAPYWVSYPEIVLLTGAHPVIIPTDFSSDLKITPAQLKEHLTAKTRMILLNSPSNPTGVAYSKSELQALGAVLLDHPEVLVVSDDIYEHILWNHLPFQNILNACPELYDRTIVINGVSKAYAMTGWRIGYAAGPENLIQAMMKVQSQSTSNPCSISQAASIAALSGDQQAVADMCKAFKARNAYAVEQLQKIKGLEVLPADGTFYLFPNCQNLLQGRNDIEFAEFLLTKAQIAVVPGSAFGAPGFIRLSIALSQDLLTKAMSRLQQAVEG